MFKNILGLCFIVLLLHCKTSDDFKNMQQGAIGVPNSSLNCIDATYPNWETSRYVLPYTIGESYVIGLSHCGGSFHGFDKPDQYATDFNMPIGTIIRSSRAGTVVFVEESGVDFNQPNNLVVVEHSDGTFAQYMHLTQYGASVDEGDPVQQGTILGMSGATGLAGYAHLHFVVTEIGDFQYPYVSLPMNFKNTTENPRGLDSGSSYEALPYF